MFRKNAFCFETKFTSSNVRDREFEPLITFCFRNKICFLKQKNCFQNRFLFQVVTPLVMSICCHFLFRKQNLIFFPPGGSMSKKKDIFVPLRSAVFPIEINLQHKQKQNF